MLKLKSVMTIEINGKDYQFSCDPDSPLQDALDANNQFNAFLLGKMQQAKQAQEKKPESNEPPEVVD
jgi:aerobic-type carbon monoxide dehydrogenase small subunit (CoxS/CutS family)